MKRIFSALVILALAAAGLWGYGYYNKLYKANVPSNLKNKHLLIYENTNFTQLTEKLVNEGFLKDKNSFLWAAHYLEFDTKPIRVGRFKIEPGMSNKKLIRLLQVGKQAPVKVSLNNKRMMEDVAGQLGKYLKSDSATFMQKFTDTAYLQSKGYNGYTIMSCIIPNTYEFFWTATPEDFIDRMTKEHDRFWNDERKNKAKALGLTPTEVYTLAAIVEKETRATEEKSRVAGVYLNRLKSGNKLEADPTVVYANRQFDLKRVLNQHLTYDSPYNTYKYVGLPPGPIYMPSIETIDKTLAAEKHNYMFFCAAPNNSGTHVFAETLAAHNANAAAFHRWLNEQIQIKRAKERGGS